MHSSRVRGDAPVLTLDHYRQLVADPSFLRPLVTTLWTSAAVGVIPNYAGNEYPATFGQSADEAGNVYVQWHRRDNAGRVEILKLGADGKVQADFVKGTETAIELPGLLSFASVRYSRRGV